MHPSTDHPVPERTATHPNYPALFVSLELSHSTWVVTSLASGSEKMSKHSVIGGDGRALPRVRGRWVHAGISGVHSGRK